MTLVRVRYQDFLATYSYAPPLVDGVVNTAEIVSAVTCDSRGAGPWTRVRFRDGSTMTIQGEPSQFLFDGDES